MIPPRRSSEAEVARTRILWAANKPAETTSAPAYVPDPPALWTIALAVFVALVLQSTLAPFFAFRGGSPSLVTLVVAWYGVRSGTLRGLALGLVAGACEDALAGQTGVAWTFATGFAGAFSGRLARTWFADTKIVLVPFAGVVTFVRFLAFALLMQAQGRALDMPFIQLRAVVWQSLFDTLIAFVVLWYVPRLGGSDAHRR